MISKIRNYYRRQIFFPSWAALFFHPFYFARKGLASAISEYASNIHGDLLDVGCGTKPYYSLFKVKTYRGLDVDSPTNRARGIADDLYDGTKFPYKDSSFDSVICNQVLEHVFNSNEFLAEINRVLKPGGKLILSIPFVWDEHEQPYDFARYTSFGLTHILKNNNFKIIYLNKLGGDATILFQLVNAYLFKISQRWSRPVRLLFGNPMIAIVNIIGLLAGKILPSNPDLFLDIIVLAEK
jgi:SAM-dependent methyltransferase